MSSLLGLVTGLLEFIVASTSLFKKKSISFFILMLLIGILACVGYCVYYIQDFIKFKENIKDPNQFVDLSEGKQVDSLYFDVIDDFKRKSKKCQKLSNKCDNGNPNSCFCSYWHAEERGDIVTFTNHFVASCYFVVTGLSGKKHTIKCSDDDHIKYERSIELSTSYYNNTLLKSSNGCISANMEYFEDIPGNIIEYHKNLDVELGKISFCTVRDKVIILTQIMGHDPVAKTASSKTGCVDGKNRDCLIELETLKYEFMKMQY